MSREEPHHNHHYQDNNDDADINDEGKLIEDEERAVGAVSWRVYLSYARHATFTLTLGFLLGYTVRQAFRMLTDYWLVLWSDASMATTETSTATGDDGGATGMRDNGTQHGVGML